MKKIFSLLAAVLFAGSMMAVEVTDVLTYQTTGVTGTNYTEWSNKKATSDAVYAGQSAASNNTIQLRSKNSNSGVVSTASAGKLVSVTVKFNSNTAADRVVDIYASNTAYTAATDLYAAATAGTKVAHFNVHADSVKTYTFADDYAYIGIRSSKDALYLDSIIVVWETGGEAPAVATPVIAGDEEFTDSVIVTITCSTPEADIYYTTDGTTDPKCDCPAAPEYTREIVLKETTTIMAAAYTGNDWSAVATKTFTKKEPVVTSGIFKVEATTPVASGDLLIDNALLTVNTAYASYVSGTSHTYSVAPEVSIEFPKAFQVRAKNLPTAENLVGEDNNSTSTADNKKASPLVFVAKEDIEVAFYYRHQCPDTSNISHQQNDNKDLKVFDQADVTAPMVTDRFVVADDGDKQYAFLAKAFSFQKGHTYTLTATGTTLPLFGFDYALAEEKMAVYNVAEAIAAADATPAQIAKDDSIVVRGVVTKLEFKGKNFAQYGSVNVYVADATGAQGSFEFYNCYSLEADTFRTSSPEFDSQSSSWGYFTSVTDGNGNAIWVGDTVMAIGKYNKYNSTYQLNTGCHLTEIIAGPRVEPDPAVDPDPIEGAITVAKAIELVNAMGDGKTSTHEFTVEGYVVNAEEFSWASASQLFFLADDAANSDNQVFEAYYCYGMENDARIALINGDKVQLTGHLQKFVKDSVLPEISNAPAVIIEKAEGERPAKPEAQEITVAQALTIGAGVADKQTTTEYYSITGYITKFIGSDGSFWMADAADGGSDKATAFEVYKGVSEATLQVGDKVNIFTRIKNYSQTIESETSVLVTVVEALKIDTINVAQAVDIALALEDNKETLKDYVILGYVAKIKTAYDAEYKNISFYMSDDATATYGDLQVYRGNIDEAAGKALAPGDRVMVVGKLKNNFYNDANSAQIAAGSEVTVMWKQALEQIVLTEKVNKVIMDGVIYIVRDGKLYNLQGAQVR